MYASVPGTSPTAVSVSASAISARPKSKSRTETRVLLGEQHVRRLHVAVDDPARVREREPLEHLRRRLDGALVAELCVRSACRSVSPGTYSYGM